jgi:hypothetical protein
MNLKKALFFTSIFLNYIIAIAQSPYKISYQAVIRNNNNIIVSNHRVGMRISILQGSATGGEIYAEKHNPITNNNGLVNIEIGDGSIEIGNLSSILWDNGPYFIKTETDPNGGSNYSLTGVSQLLSVPYALYSNFSKNANDTTRWSLNGNQRMNSSSFIGSTDTSAVYFRVNNVNAGFLDYKFKNTAFGYNTLKSPYSGNENVSIGVSNLSSLTTGFGNVAVGVENLILNKSGFANLCIGNHSQNLSEEAVFNISLGFNNLTLNKKGNSNIAIGINTLRDFDFPVNIASYNTAIGEGAMERNIYGYRNNAIGAYALRNLTGGQQNTAIGIDAGQNLKSGNGNILIGNGSDVSDSAISNSIVIGNSAVVSKSNSFILGDENNTSLNVGIGTSSPERKLHIKSVMRLEPLNDAPLNPSRGDIYFDGTLNKLRVFDGSIWQNCW